MTTTETSVRAYRETVDSRASLCACLLALYKSHGPMTDREAGRHLGWHPSSVSARRNDLDGVVLFGLKKDPITGKSGRVHGLATLV